VERIDGDDVTIVDNAGKQAVIKSPVNGLKIGDVVTVDKGRIIKGGGVDASPRLNPQLEPPSPVRPGEKKPGF
jgi:hypothetical protein